MSPGKGESEMGSGFGSRYTLLFKVHKGRGNFVKFKENKKRFSKTLNQKA